MSGICGIVCSRRSAPPDGEALRKLTSMLEQRGPDGTRHWTEGNAALGHTLLASTPEARVECLPLVHSGTGCVITADIRLDNREELAALLSVDLTARVVGDGELVLLAYLKWGEGCPEHLLGDFAFAIWDPRDRKLFAARDQMGVKQLIYGVTDGSRLIFASRPKAVRSIAPDAFPLNEGRIADFLEDMEGIDRTSTFFRGIFRLPPAHRLVFDANGLRISRYWDMEMPPELTGLSDAEYEEAFLEVFTDAVRARLRSDGPVGAMMSGGMDSGSVVAIASDLLAQAGGGPLPTYSVVNPNDKDCKETRAVDAMMAVPGIKPTRIPCDGPEDMLQLLFEAMRNSEEPFDSTMTLLRAVYATAQADGLRVVLDGVAGDVVFSEGDVHARLLAQGRWRDILEDAAGSRKFWGGFGPHPAWALATAAWRVALPEQVRMARHKVKRALRPPAPNRLGMVSDDLARRVDIEARRRRFYSRSRSAPSAPRLGAVLGTSLIVGRERYDRVASEFGIEPRDPFMDLRVIRTCLQMPPQVMQAKGWPKYLLRRAMESRLPAAVCWRQDKSHLGWQMTTSVLKRQATLDAGELKLLRKLGVADEALSSLQAAPEENLAPKVNTIILTFLATWDR